MQWEAILLAGGKLEDDFELFGDLPSKAYLPIHGKRMADYVLDALKGVPAITRIISVVPHNAPEFLGTTAVVGGNSIVESMAAGFQAVNPRTEMALVVTCDLPLLNPDSITDFLNQCETAQAGLCFGYVSKTDSEAKFPGLKHTWVKTNEGELCGSGLIGIAPSCFPALRRFAAEATQNRKNVFKIAKLFGIPFILKLITKKLAIADAERRATQLLGFRARGIQSRFPEIAFNVDDTETLASAVSHLNQVAV